MFEELILDLLSEELIVDVEFLEELAAPPTFWERYFWTGRTGL